MGKIKIPIIITLCVLIMFILTGYLFFRKDSSRSNNPLHTDRDTVAASVVSGSAISKSVEKSGNYTYIPPTYEYDDSDNNEDNKEDHMQINEPTKTPWIPSTEMDLDPKSITVFVNKEYCLPQDYVPENLVIPNIPFDITGDSERKYMRKEAAEAIERLFAAALEDGYTLYAISGYRSYERQKEIFLNNIVHKGKKHTLRYSAAPGTSEHQTGLAMDVSSKSVRYKLVTSFAKCNEGKWLAENAHRFGFIIRYPKDHYDVTGYAYEPWHIRYVGEDLANYLYSNNMTLDEYYNYVPSKDFDFEEKYADLINYKPPITPTPIPEEELEEPIPSDELTDEEFVDDDMDLEDDESDEEDLDDSESDENLGDNGYEDENPEDDESDDTILDDEPFDEDLENSESDDEPIDGNTENDGSEDKGLDGYDPDNENTKDIKPDDENPEDAKPDDKISDDKESDNGKP